MKKVHNLKNTEPEKKVSQETPSLTLRVRDWTALDALVRFARLAANAALGFSFRALSSLMRVGARRLAVFAKLVIEPPMTHALALQ